MLKNIKRNIVNTCLNIKCLFRENKWIAAALIISVVIAFFSSLQGIKDKAAGSSGGNIIIFINNQEFNYLLFLLKIVGMLLLLYILLIFTPHNFYLFLISFISAALVSYLLFRNAFIACIVDGFTAYVVLIFLWLPLMLISSVCYFCSVCKIYNVCGYTFLKRRAICVPAFRHLVSLISKYLIADIIACMVYYSLFVIVLTLIY